MNETQFGFSEQERSPVLKALRLLAYLSASKEPVSLADLSRALNLPKPTALRLARLIERSGFVHKDPLTGRYSVGTAFEDLALSALRHGVGQMPRRLRMNQLAERLGARVNLVVLKAGNVSFVEWVESTAPLRIEIESDLPMPVHCSASGKLLLAFGSEHLQAQVLGAAPLESYTKKTITTAQGLEREFAKTCKRGYAEDDQELLPGVNCLAVPVYNSAGQVVAGLSVMALTASLPLEKLRGHLQDIRNCAASISEELGGPAAPSEAGLQARRSNGRTNRTGAAAAAPQAVGKLTT